MNDHPTPEGFALVPLELTPEMVAAYLSANAAYWQRTDELPPPPHQWRTGTPAAATAEGYRALIAAAPSAPVAEVPAALLVRDIAHDFGVAPLQVCRALETLGHGPHSVNMMVTGAMARDLKAHFAASQRPAAGAGGGEPVAHCSLTANGKIEYFDGKPMVMPGTVGNELHPTPLYTSPTADQADAARQAIDKLALHVINTAREAMNASTESGGDGVVVPDHLAGPLSLALAEYDAAIAAGGAPEKTHHGHR